MNKIKYPPNTRMEPELFGFLPHPNLTVRNMGTAHVPEWNNRCWFPLFQIPSKDPACFHERTGGYLSIPKGQNRRLLYIHENRSFDVFFFFLPHPRDCRREELRELPWYPVGALAPWFWATSKTSYPVFLKEPAVIWQFPKVPELPSCISNTRMFPPSMTLQNHPDNRIFPPSMTP